MRYKLTAIILLFFVSAVFADYRELFEKEFVHKPWIGSAVVEEGVCIDCHTSDVMKQDYLGIPQEWKMSIHYANGVSCHNCHGGDPDDAAVSCGTPHSGFVGTPPYNKVPEMCGQCHIGILNSYNKSGHGKALRVSGEGPNCVTCHGSHKIQKASMDIIKKVRCSICHSYERAKIMKKALFMTEKKISDLDNAISKLIALGVFADEEQKMLFRTHAEFRTLFHTIDVALVKNRTDEFLKKLDVIEDMIMETNRELGFRKNFSAFLFLLFVGMVITGYLLHRKYED